MLGRGGRTVDADLFDTNATSKMFSAVFFNPPYDNDPTEPGQRLETKFLRHVTPWLRPEGVLIAIVPIYLLAHEPFSNYLLSQYNTPVIYRFPDPEFAVFSQIVLFAKKRPRSTTAPIGLMRRLHQIGTARNFFPLEERPANVEPFVLPENETHRSMVWRKVINPDDVKDQLAHRPTAFLRETVEGHISKALQLSTPLTPYRIGHLPLVAAAGGLDNALIPDDEGPCLIKGTSVKRREEVLTEEDDETPDTAASTVVRKNVLRDRPVTTIYTINQEGTVTKLEGAELVKFIERNHLHLINVLSERAKPLYDFTSLNGYGTVLNTLNQGRVIPNTNGMRGLLPAQQHAVAAIATRLKVADDAILNGKMGVGKTVMASAIAACRYHDLGGGRFRAVVLCPPHLVNKWIREIKIVWPQAIAVDISDPATARSFMKPSKIPVMIGVLKSTAASLGNSWEHAFVYNRVHPLPVDKDTRRPVNKKDDWIADLYEYDGLPTSLPKRYTDYLERHGNNENIRYILETRLRESGLQCPVCGVRHDEKDIPMTPGAMLTKRKRACSSCGSPLWQEIPPSNNTSHRLEMRRYLAHLGKRYGTKIDLLIADEVHEYKGASANRAQAFGQLASQADKVVSLTGTIFGGLTSSIFYLLYRTAADFRRRYTNEAETGNRRLMYTEFSRRYGLEQVTITERASNNHRGRNTVTETSREIPGLDPALLNIIASRTLFMDLTDLAMALPEMTQTPHPVKLTDQMQKDYNEIQSTLYQAMAQALAKGSKALLSTYLRLLMSWPEIPSRQRTIEDPDGNVILVTPPYPESMRTPKEEAVLNAIRKELDNGRRVLLYIQMTATTDITPRWEAMLKEAGIKTAICRADTNKREEWFANQVAKGVQVVMVHPRRVALGLDLIDFPVLMFLHEMEFSPYTISQASSRSYRIGQEHDVTVYFWYYTKTMQAHNLAVMAAKIAANIRLSGAMLDESTLGSAGDSGADSVQDEIMRHLKEMQARQKERKTAEIALDQLRAGIYLSDEIVASGAATFGDDTDKAISFLEALIDELSRDDEDIQQATLNELFGRVSAGISGKEPAFIGDSTNAEIPTLEADPDGPHNPPALVHEQLITGTIWSELFDVLASTAVPYDLFYQAYATGSTIVGAAIQEFPTTSFLIPIMPNSDSGEYIFVTHPDDPLRMAMIGLSEEVPANDEPYIVIRTAKHKTKVARLGTPHEIEMVPTS